MTQLQALRELQDQTNALLSVVAETSADPGLASDWLRATSLCRLYLDNVPHVEASWATQGPGLGQAALHLGADDFGRIPLSAADPRVVEDTIAEVERNIRAAGFVPVRRDGTWRWQGEPRSQPDPEGRPLRRHSAAATSPA
jgi:cyclic dehypoxanthinyl futalosine synthase